MTIELGLHVSLMMARDRSMLSLGHRTEYLQASEQEDSHYTNFPLL